MRSEFVAPAQPSSSALTVLELHVRVGSTADICSATVHVRFGSSAAMFAAPVLYDLPPKATSGDAEPMSLLHHRLSPSWLSTERMMAMNATKVSTALTACEYSHCRRAASKASGAIVQFLVATFIGYVKIQKITCVAARQRTAVTDIKKAARSLRIVKVWIEVRRSAVIIGIPKKAQPA